MPDQVNRAMRKRWYVDAGEKFANEECSVTRRIVIVDNLVARLPQIRLFSLNVLPESSQDITV